MTDSTPSPADRTTTTATATAPDLTGIRLAHRAILGDIDRLVTLLTDLTTRTRTTTRVTAPPVDHAHARAVAAYVHRFNAAVRHHHRNEDDILWPVVAAAAEGAVDLAPLSEEHDALQPLQDACDWAATLFGEAPAQHAGRLAEALTAQRDVLVDHITAEERDLFPVITRHVRAQDYADAEARIRRATPVEHAAWMRGWLMSYATTEDLRVLAPGGASTAAAGAESVFRAYTDDEVEVFGAYADH
ncbi:hemerythrin domain-containing protein [Streptomyces lasiicapitis]|uniref:hemerythrin domain-containing protein n=1 Tax=Streptomyces lasiicapitis TaxID=1923961 RepID=UPI003316EEA4